MAYPVPLTDASLFLVRGLVVPGGVGLVLIRTSPAPFQLGGCMCLAVMVGAVSATLLAVDVLIMLVIVAIGVLDLVISSVRRRR